jgi:hypothetical protein
MGEWSTYTLSDFLMFSPQAYARLLERYNAAWWPVHGLLLAAGIALLAIARSRSARAMRAAFVLLAAAWVLTGWAFHWQRYAEIFLGAPLLALGCWAQGVLLLLACAARIEASRASRWRDVPAGILLLVGAVLYPLLAPLTAKPWPQAEMFALMPDPTALATLGVVLLAPVRVRGRLLLSVLPAASLAVGLATRWTLAQ